MAMLALALAVCITLLLTRAPRVLTQKDINAAVLKTLESTTLPSAAAKAYETVLPSVVRVMAYAQGKDDDDDQGMGVGTGVVIVNKGVILTNLHVIQGAHTIKVVFADGLESTARVINTQPENDLAVLQADKIPDDLFAATMRSTADLQPGDQVLAVGFPFGIGPSASHLHRHWLCRADRERRSRLRHAAILSRRAAMPRQQPPAIPTPGTLT